MTVSSITSGHNDGHSACHRGVVDILQEQGSIDSISISLKRSALDRVVRILQRILQDNSQYYHSSPLQSGSMLILLSTSSRRMLMSCHSGTATDRDHSKWTGYDAAVVPIQ